MKKLNNRQLQNTKNLLKKNSFQIIIIVALLSFSFRDNFSGQQFKSFLPTASIVAYPVNTGGINTPDGDIWLICDGQYHPKRRYPQLSKILKETWGKYRIINDEIHFAIPDFRGRFLRGANFGAYPKVDLGPDRYYKNDASAMFRDQEVGSYQDGQIKGHDHGGGFHNHGGGGHKHTINNHSHGYDTHDGDNSGANQNGADAGWARAAFRQEYTDTEYNLEAKYKGGIVKWERVINADLSKKETTVKNAAVNYFIKAN